MLVGHDVANFWPWVDHDAFIQFHRLDRESFKTVRTMVAPFITKQDTNMISPA